MMRDINDDLVSFDALAGVSSETGVRTSAADSLFAFADRRCRQTPDAAPEDLLLRATALRSLGLPEASLKDLRAAFDRAPDTTIVTRSLLGFDPEPESRTRAALSLIDNPRAGDADLDAALAHLVSTGRTVVLRAHRAGDMVSGWVARTGSAALKVEAVGEEGAIPIALRDAPGHPFPSFSGQVSHFRLSCDPTRPVEIRATEPDGPVVMTRLYAVALPASLISVQAGAARRVSRLNVIVPLYRDHEAAKACLEALAYQDCTTPVRVILVDDASPDEAIKMLAERFRRLHDATLVVNRVNHGFAGAVNAAIARCDDGDVLLLNSDVTLPPGALERLIRIAYSSPDIGTIMPFSNDSELTSFPIPYKPNPLESGDRALRIDDAAFRANGDAVLDIPNTIGFCVYVTRPCLAATGPLSPDYGRGYYEDVELALKARERGFRNVAALGLYVSHGSGRSFGAHKNALVARNLPVVSERFASFRSESRAFVESDPLRAARSAVEAALPPQDPTHLLVGAAAGPGSPIDLRARRILDEGGFVLMLSWRQGGAAATVSLRASRGFGPRSLDIVLDAAGLDRLSDYIMALRLVQIELSDLHTLPSPLYRLLLRTSAPILFFVASLDDALLINSGVPQPGHERLTSRDIAVDFLGFDREADIFAYRIPQFLMRSAPVTGGSKFVTADSMAEALCADLQHHGRAATTGRAGPQVHQPSRGEPKSVVAILAPSTSPAVDLLLLEIARHLRPRSSTRLVVLGRCVDERPLTAIGNVHVAGAVEVADYRWLLEAYGADAVFLPYRTSLFSVLEDLQGRIDLPRGYFDWSGGLMRFGDDDFVLDCRLGGDIVCVEFARWCVSAGSVLEVPQ